ncbi:hypothetical protein HRI_000308100 [Hibiscus trionum]|uniref:Uncharacterized protein n=1 Tax=Hibiscus trionum TaxID=183268 RepID=A0A9W7GW99_HIBTR|nr:hypothetical protein HRI_000308100 [Hibiscus trionum]
MDVEPLWALVGVPASFASPTSTLYMAAAAFIKPPPPPPPPPPLSKPHFLLICLSLFFTLLLLLNPTINPSADTRRLLPDTSSEPTSSTMNIDQTPKPHSSSSSSWRRQFGAAAHEVPSGPNPISNR